MIVGINFQLTVFLLRIKLNTSTIGQPFVELFEWEKPLVKCLQKQLEMDVFLLHSVVMSDGYVMRSITPHSSHHEANRKVYGLGGCTCVGIRRRPGSVSFFTAGA